MSLRDSYYPNYFEALGAAAAMILLERWAAWRDPSLGRIRYRVVAAWTGWWRVEAVPRG